MRGNYVKKIFQKTTALSLVSILMLSLMVSVPLFLSQNAVAAPVVDDFPSPKVNAENFNTIDPVSNLYGYAGISVGFNIENFNTVSDVRVELYKDVDLLVTNTHNNNLLELINDGGITQLSTAFFTEPGTYTEDYWNLGSFDWTDSFQPTRAVVYVTDASGIYTAESTVLSEDTITFDELAHPDVPQLLSPTNNSTVNASSPMANTWQSVFAAEYYKYQSYDTNEAGNCNTSNVHPTQDYTENQTNSRAIADGTIFCWRVIAVDVYGNPSEWSEPWKVTIDNTAPVADPSGSQTGTTLNGQLKGNITESQIASASIQWKQISGPGTSTITNATSKDTTVTVSAYGTYVFELTVTDQAGNSTPETTTVIFNEPPVIQTPQAPQNPTTPTTPTIVTTDDETETETETDETLLAFFPVFNEDGTIVQASPNEPSDDDENGDILGAEDIIAQTDNESEEDGFKPMSLMWYWWLVILGALAGLWWLIAGLRRRRQQS